MIKLFSWNETYRWILVLFAYRKKQLRASQHNMSVHNSINDIFSFFWHQLIVMLPDISRDTHHDYYHTTICFTSVAQVEKDYNTSLDACVSFHSGYYGSCIPKILLWYKMSKEIIQCVGAEMLLSVLNAYCSYGIWLVQWI